MLLLPVINIVFIYTVIKDESAAHRPDDNRRLARGQITPMKACNS